MSLCDDYIIKIIIMQIDNSNNLEEVFNRISVTHIVVVAQCFPEFVDLIIPRETAVDKDS